MDTQRTRNFGRNWRYQMSDNGATFQTRNSTQHMDNCLCKFCGKTVNNQFHFRQCIAKTSFCYKCRNFGHYARMCDFHRQPDVKVVKVKSKSKLRRDAERMRIFKENKAMSIFPCAELTTIELMDFFPAFNYDREFIDSVTLHLNHIAIGRSIGTLENILGTTLHKQEMEAAYLNFEALCDHEYEFNCILCGYYPKVVIWDTFRKASFRYAGGWAVGCCGHGVVYAIKCLLRSESPRDYVDLEQSLKHIPNITICDIAHLVAKHGNKRFKDMFTPNEGRLAPATEEIITLAESGRLRLRLLF
ncbi:unnamed protein product [Mytilus edulis]|uniref:CCHC-type domain-containing protein n=1 Tax=Mytilus edulis TaxID=6550 RepID=A0A8S3TYN0_MYTED|nr:unnamed protein product [Mytilus edulis]